MGNFIIELGRRFGMTRAVLFSMLSQSWMALAGPATIVVIARFLSPEIQGFYYTFSSVLSIQVFFEMGLATVIVQTASHEWASLRRGGSGDIEGDRIALSRLASLGRFSLMWYAAAAVLFVGVLVVGGKWFFADKAAKAAVSWFIPWLALSVATGLYLFITPMLSLVEGCNQVSSVYGIRLIQAIASSAGIILALSLGFGLYSLVFGTTLRLIIGIYWLLRKQRGFVHLVLRSSLTEVIKWREDVWPFQWRIAVSWLSGYFIFSLFTPLMFQFFGAVVAGQMGMAMALVGAIESFSCAWLNTRTPVFGVMVAQRKYTELDGLFHRSMKQSICIAVLGFLAVVGGMVFLEHYLPRYAVRLLPLIPMALLAFHRVANVIIAGLAYYLRAHKREPLMMVSVVAAIAVGATSWVFGRAHGPTGIAVGLLVTTLVWTLPSCYVVFRRCRAAWHIT